MQRSISIFVGAAFAIMVLSAAAQQPSSSGYEKKEFTHSAWTKGIFSEAVTVKGLGAGKFVFLAGVGSEDENGPRGNIRHHNDLVAQCEYAFDKIKRVLAAHSANMNYVVKITSYLTDMKNRVPYGQCLTRNFGAAPLPVHTLIGVAALAFPEMMVETDVTAITPE
jgi:enamine deaminase RidA (YjgF/YER057c/UK114 family)